MDADIGGFPLLLQDTAGQRFGDDVGAVEREGVRRAQQASATADLRVCVQDITAGATCSSLVGLAATPSHCLCAQQAASVPTLVLLNKVDRLDSVQRAKLSRVKKAIEVTGGPDREGTMETHSTVSMVDIVQGCCLPGQDTNLDEFMEILEREVAHLCEGTTQYGPAVARTRHRAHLQVIHGP